MNLINKKVKHRMFGVGTIKSFDENRFVVQFESKTSIFAYPEAFESFLKAEDDALQNEIEELIVERKRLKEEEKQRLIIAVTEENKKKEVKTLDDLFTEEYHVEFLKRHPILNYKQVEEQFNIRIAGFGRGINITESTIVLISSIGKAEGKFTYHDHWTTDGDYLYSGEGKNGDQSLTKGNIAIVNSEQDNKSIHLFVKFSPQEYFYQGVFKLVDYSFEDEADETGNTRKEYKFRLRRINVDQ